MAILRKVHIAWVLTLVALMPSAPAAVPAHLMPPDLVPLPPRDVIGPETGPQTTWPFDVPIIVDGCFADEMARKGAERCLRFDGIVANIGDGAFEVTYRIDASESFASAYQRIYDGVGGHTDTFSTRSEFHPTHAHFHIKDFYVARLWRATEGGRVRGREPVARGDKNGFCPEDAEPINQYEPDDRQMQYSCMGETDRFEPGGQVVGISPRWTDIYGAHLPDQFVEISGVPDGYYVLEIEIDPNDIFEEADETNNTACSLVRLRSTVADLVDPETRCPAS